MLTIATPRIPKGHWILVTGADGYIGSHVVDVLLEEGYNVRGSVRYPQQWLHDFFTNKYGAKRFEMAVIEDLTDHKGFDRAARDMSGVIHTSSILSFSPKPDEVIPAVVAGTLNALKAAARQSSMRSFVLTSSSAAALLPQEGAAGVVVSEATWNDESVRAAHSSNTPTEQLPLIVYAASKTEGERALWQWTAEAKPSFTVNTILPNLNFGRILIPEIQTGSMWWIRRVLHADLTMFNLLGPQYFVDVRDNARLHVAALLDPAVKSQRVFAWAYQCNQTNILRILRKLRPDNRLIPPEPPNEGQDLTNVEVVSKEAEELLCSSFGTAGWTKLEDSIREGLDGFA